MIVLGIDPGRKKCGWAVVSKDRGELAKGITSLKKLKETINEIGGRYTIHKVVIGDKTGGGLVEGKIRESQLSVEIVRMEEHLTSIEAKVRFFKDNPPKGIWRLVPLAFQSPSRSVDDYVALILGERFIAEIRENSDKS